MKKLLTTLLLFIFILFYDIIDLSAQERFSFRSLLNHASELSNHDVVLLGVIEHITTKRAAAGETYYELDIYKDITVIVSDQVWPHKTIRHGDLIEISGTFYDFTKYYGTLYNNLIIANHIRKLESS